MILVYSIGVVGGAARGAAGGAMKGAIAGGKSCFMSMYTCQIIYASNSYQKSFISDLAWNGCR